jgi:hypothetical protein
MLQYDYSEYPLMKEMDEECTGPFARVFVYVRKDMDKEGISGGPRIAKLQAKLKGTGAISNYQPHPTV